MSSMFWMFVTGTPGRLPHDVLNRARYRLGRYARARDPRHRAGALHQRVQRVGHLRERDVHHRARITGDAVRARVADDTDDLPHRLLRELLHVGRAAADQNLLRERIATVRPVLVHERLVDDDHGRRRAAVAVVERAAADDGHVEGVEVPGHAQVEPAAAGERPFVGAADDVHRQPIAALERHAARQRRGHDARVSGGSARALSARFDRRYRRSDTAGPTATCASRARSRLGSRDRPCRARTRCGSRAPHRPATRRRD